MYNMHAVSLTGCSLVRIWNHVHEESLGRFSLSRNTFLEYKHFKLPTNVVYQSGRVSNFLWSPYGIGQTIYIFMLSFVLSSSSFFPRLISAAADWMSVILLHMVWP